MNKTFVPVITSLADTDLYKFTMLQAMLHQTPGAMAQTEFVCRNTPLFPLAELRDEVIAQLEHLCTLRFTADELAYFASKSYFKPDFVQQLRRFQLYMDFITVEINGDQLEIKANGPLTEITLFELFVLSIVNELYFRRTDQEVALAEGRRRLQAKIAQLRDFDLEAAATSGHPFEFFDFGMRRRFSRAWQEEVVTTLAREVPQFFKGTSNVDLARRLNIVCIGTMAHEWLQLSQQLGDTQLQASQRHALELWAKEYRGELGVALTDVINTDAFLKDFDRFFAALFDGVRHDSGDPKVWGEKFIAHYKKLKIDPRTKRLVFSDGLSLDVAIDLWRHFGKRIQTGFGIGTWLTNDVGLVPLNVVMKLMTVNNRPVAKISDSPGKTLCKDKVFLRYLCQVFNVDASFIDKMAD